MASVFGAILLGLVVAISRLRSRFTVAWGSAGTLTALGLPAGVLGEWAAAVTLLVAGLAFMGGLARLDARDDRAANR